MAADRFTRLEKIAVFLIAIGEEQTRRFLADLDLQTVEEVNEAIAELGSVTPGEKAAVMIEFADFFFRDKPLQRGKSGSARRPPPGDTPGPGRTRGAVSSPPAAESPEAAPTPPPTPKARPADKREDSAPPTGDEDSILDTLEKLRQRVDPKKIDWGRAGYDFGEGFKGTDSERP